MPTRRTLVKSEAGVSLERVEHLSRQGRVHLAVFQLSTIRQERPRLLSDEREALDAFDLEVIATLVDPETSKVTDQDAL